MRRAFVSLGYPNYRRWFTGQLISMAGTWMQATALSYLAFELTKSPAFLGFIALAQGVPAWFFMIYAGTLVDRLPRRNILIMSQLAMMVLAIVLAVLTGLKLLEPWHILVISTLLGFANSFDTPARQSFASELVERKDLTNAMALNGALFNLGSTIGPAFAGVIYVIYGPTLCFILNALSFLAVLIALLRMDLPRREAPKIETSVIEQLREGLVYASSHQLISLLIVLVGLMSLFGVSVVTIFPAWAVHQLNGDARVAGYLQAGRGVGAVTGALLVAYFASSMRRGQWVSMGVVCLPIALVSFSISRDLGLSIFCMALLGVTQIMILNLSNSLIHSEVDDRLRGRVASIFGLTFMGLMPVGGVIMGSLAENFSEPAAVKVSAVAFGFCAFIALYLKKNFRAIA